MLQKDEKSPTFYTLPDLKRSNHENFNIQGPITELSGDWQKNQTKQIIELPLLSFFTGAGFLDLGFHFEGFRVVWHNECETQFIGGFESGFSSSTGEKIKIQNDQSLIEIGPNQIAREAFGHRKAALSFGIIGGPPCPDFSIGGKNRGIAGDNGKLSRVYVDRIIELKPAFFVFENVKGLFRTTKHKTFFNSLVRDLEAVGYRIDYKILNAIDFGVPQDRQRIFIVGFHKTWLTKNKFKIKFGERDWFPWPIDCRFLGAKSKYTWPTVSPFGATPSKPPDIPNELMIWSYLRDTALLEKLPNGMDCFKPYSKKFNTIMEGDTSRKSFKRLHRWRYSPTAAYGNNEVHLHPALPRRISVREAMRIQTAPDSYILPENMPLTYKFKTVGNAVPVNLAKAVAISIKNFMET